MKRLVFRMTVNDEAAGNPPETCFDTCHGRILSKINSGLEIWSFLATTSLQRVSCKDACAHAHLQCTVKYVQSVRVGPFLPLVIHTQLNIFTILLSKCYILKIDCLLIIL